MVQQKTDSNFNKYGMPCAETGLLNRDKQLLLPVTAKNTVLRKLQNENRIAVPKLMGSSLFSKENGPTQEAVKLPGNLVYVRRRPEVEPAKSSSFHDSSNNVLYPARKLGDQDDTKEQNSQVKKPNICIPEVAPILRDSSTCFSSGKPSVPSSLGKSSNILQPSDSDYLLVSAPVPPLDYPERMNNQHWEERYFQLQDLLKMLGQSNQEDYLQMLRSLSPVELSRHAVELEKRSIQLSLEEAKEMQRVQLLDVLGKYSQNSGASFAQQVQTQK